jgi:hypothetical protein
VRVFDLVPAERKAKARALALHHGQVGPLSDSPGDDASVPAGFRAHFAREFETLIEGHPLSPADAPAPGDPQHTLTSGCFDDVYS